jgi:hypothetical protein
MLYRGDYIEGPGSRRTRITVEDGDAAPPRVLAEGPSVVLDWETSTDKAQTAAIVLRHALARQPEPDELLTFLDEIAIDWVAREPWELPREQLAALGLLDD